MAQLQFDARTVAPKVSLDPLPAGWYNAAIDSSEMKPTKDGLGSYLELRFSVLDGQYAGRKVFARLNLRNANVQAQEIAYQDLSAICHATNIIQLNDSTQLHNVPLKIKLSVRAASGDYEASNDIKGYKNVNDTAGDVNAATQAQGWQQPTPPQQQAQPQQAPQQQAQPQQQWQQPAQQQPQQAQQWQQPQQGAPAQPWQQPQQQQPVQQQQAPQQWQQQAQPQQAQPQQQQPMQQPAQQQQTPAQGVLPPWAQQQVQQG